MRRYLGKADLVLTSDLTLVECERAIIRTAVAEVESQIVPEISVREARESV